MAGLLLQDLGELKRPVAPDVQRVLKAVALGSVAGGESDAWSNLDRFIIAETSRPFFEPLEQAWWVSILGDWVRDRLDPKLRQV